MTTVNMLEAKTRLSQLVEAVENGVESEIIIARNGKPAARLIALDATNRPPRRLGVAKGVYEAPADPFEQDAEVADLLLGGDR
jgi:prevent-host-death family protein